MLAEIQAYAKMATPTSLDPNLVVSKQLELTDGTVASGANRYDADTIAKYMFSEGAGSTMAYDTSGIDPAANLTLTGHYQFDGSWGIIFLAGGGKAQATVQASSKLNTLIQATGEFSIEAWVAPAVVATNLSDIVSYSGGDTLRNVTLAQTNQDYDFSLRSSNSNLNGAPMLQTPDATMALQASLQHVVLTYDPVNGRQIYVNGVNQNIPDPQKGGTISNWDSTFALVLGSEVSGDNAFQGEIKFLAIHSRALSAAQVLQNFNAGVGQRYYLLFNVSSVARRQRDSGVHHVHGEPVRQLQLPVLPAHVHLPGSDREADQHSDQRHAHRHQWNDSARGSGVHPAQHHDHGGELLVEGDILSTVGTVIGLENGPLTDQFFLQFDTLGTQHDVIVEATAAAARDPGLPGAPYGRLRRTHLRAGELDVLAAHRRADLQRVGRDHLSERSAAAPADQHARGVFVRQSGRRRPAGGAVLQPSDEHPLPCRRGVPGRELRCHDVFERDRQRPECCRVMQYTSSRHAAQWSPTSHCQVGTAR